jgi:uncharacterized phage protein (TIGR02218 family)
MTFDSYEQSNQSGAPISLYEFRWGAVFWRYTSADQNIPFDGEEFRAVAISDSGMVQGGSAAADFTVSLQSNLPIVDLFRQSAPSETIWLTVRRKHFGDPTDEAAVYWVGRVANVKRLENLAAAEARCIALGSMFKQGGLRLSWDRNCPHALYDSQCRVNPLDHEYQRIVETVTGSVIRITVATLPTEGSFTGGYVEWDRGGGGTLDRKGIEEMISDREIRVFGGTDGLAPGDTVWIHPGCTRTTDVCNGGFGNIKNFGGFPFMPGKSPFDGTPVF